MDTGKDKKIIISEDKNIVWNIKVRVYDEAISIDSCTKSVFKLMKIKVVLN
jgi:hypothetical protein